MSQTLSEYNIFLNKVVSSPDQKTIASAADDGTVRVWDRQTLECICVLGEGSSPIYDVRYSPDGKYIAEGGWDQTIRVWEWRSKSLKYSVKVPASVSCISYSPDGLRIAAGCGNSAYIICTETEQIITQFPAHKTSMLGITFSRKGEHIATCSWDTNICIWDSLTGKLIQTLIGHTDHINCVAYSPDGAHLVSAAGDGTTRVWECDTGKLRAFLRRRYEWASSASFSPDGEYIVSAGVDRVVSVWDWRREHLVTGFEFPATPLVVPDSTDVYFFHKGDHMGEIPFFSVQVVLSGWLSNSRITRLSDPRIWGKVRSFL